MNEAITKCIACGFEGHDDDDHEQAIIDSMEGESNKMQCPICKGTGKRKGRFAQAHGFVRMCITCGGSGDIVVDLDAEEGGQTSDECSPAPPGETPLEDRNGTDEPDFDGAGEAKHGKKEWARMQRDEDRWRQRQDRLDAYLLKRLQYNESYSARMDELVEQGWIERRSGNVMRLTFAGSEHYNELPSFFVIDNSRNGQYQAELVAKGENWGWVTVMKDGDDVAGDGCSQPAKVNWNAIGASDPHVTRIFMSMLAEATNIAGRWDDEVQLAEVSS